MLLEFLKQKHHAIDIEIAREEAQKRKLNTEAKKSNKKQVSGVFIVLMIVLALVRFGIRYSHNNHSDSYHREDPVEQIARNLITSDLDTIHPWNGKHILICIPSNMKQIVSDSTMMDVEEEYRRSYLYQNIFSIYFNRVLKSECRKNNIKDLQTLVAFIQTTTLPEDSLKYTIDADMNKVDLPELRRIESENGLANLNEFSVLYYEEKRPDFFGKIAYIDGGEYYYSITAYTHPEYKEIFNYLMTKILRSININQ
jgi:hypothetical protein